jgi:hypothetical protein
MKGNLPMLSWALPLVVNPVALVASSQVRILADVPFSVPAMNQTVDKDFWVIDVYARCPSSDESTGICGQRVMREHMAYASFAPEIAAKKGKEFPVFRTCLPASERQPNLGLTANDVTKTRNPKEKHVLQT